MLTQLILFNVRLIVKDVIAFGFPESKTSVEQSKKCNRMWFFWYIIPSAMCCFQGVRCFFSITSDQISSRLVCKLVG